MAAVFSSHVLSATSTSIPCIRSLHSTPIKSKNSVPVSCSQSQNSTRSRRRPEYIPDHIPDPNYVRILDTTLRDGEQAPGASMTAKQKLDIAWQLARLGVDIIEAGFPAASKDDFEAVKMIAKEVGNAVDDDGYVPVIGGVCRCNEKDTIAAWEAVKYATRPRICSFIATSNIHMEYKLKKTKQQVLEIARNMVNFARSLGCDDVEFVPEDAARFARSFLFIVLAIRMNITTFPPNIESQLLLSKWAKFANLARTV